MTTAAQFDELFVRVLQNSENDKNDIIVDFLSACQNWLTGDGNQTVPNMTEEAEFLVTEFHRHLHTMLHKRVVSTMNKAHSRMGKS